MMRSAIFLGGNVLHHTARRPLKGNRRVSVDREVGYQNLNELNFDEQTSATGLIVKLQKLPFRVKLFKLVTPDGRIEWIITAGDYQTIKDLKKESENW